MSFASLAYTTRDKAPAVEGISIMKHGDVTDGESGRYWAVCKLTDDSLQDDDREILCRLGAVRYYGGPGRYFCDAGWIRWHKTRKGVFTVTQHWGFDI